MTLNLRRTRSGRAPAPGAHALRWRPRLTPPFLVMAVLLLDMAGLGVGCGRTKPERLVVVGLDGATWELLEPWIQAGDLPNLKAFRDASAWGTMNSVVPYLSPPAWTSAVTGVNPGRHGIFDFQRRLPGQNVIVTETSKSRRSPPVWNLLRGSGKKVAILNIPMTDPPDEVDGVMVAGFPHLDSLKYAFPPSLEVHLSSLAYGHKLDHMEMKLPEGEEQRVLDGIRASRDEQWQVFREFLRDPEYDFLWIVFTGTDRVQHLFWKFDDPSNPHYDAAAAARFGGTMRRFWMEQDKILGELFSLCGPDTWVLVLSDHGFGPIRRELRVGNWLRTAGAGVTEDEAQDVFVLDPSDAARLYIREPGRDPGGTRSAPARAALREKLYVSLQRAVDPGTGARPVEALHRNEEVFVGKYAEKGPGLNILPSFAYYINWGDADTGFKLPCCGEVLSTLSGWHRMDGLFLLRGPGAKPGKLKTAPSLLDVAPTCLYLLDRPLPEDFDGKIMDGVLQPSWLKAHAATYKGRLSEEDRPLTPEEQRALRNLPYVGK